MVMQQEPVKARIWGSTDDSSTPVTVTFICIEPDSKTATEEFHEILPVSLSTGHVVLSRFIVTVHQQKKKQLFLLFFRGKILLALNLDHTWVELSVILRFGSLQKRCM